jgi:hypothetical protein
MTSDLLLAFVGISGNSLFSQVVKAIMAVKKFFSFLTRTA